MTRERIPNRRPALTFEFEHVYPGAGPRVFTATVGFYPGGRVAEVFVDLVDGADKGVSVDAHDAAVLISFALQHGADLKDMGAAMLRGSDGVAHGFMGSLVDALGRELGGISWAPDPDAPAPTPQPDSPTPGAPAQAAEVAA